MKIVEKSVLTGESVHIGEGTIIKGAVTVEDGVVIGNYCIIEATEDRRIHIGKGSRIGDMVKIFAGVEIAGDCHLGDFVILGHPSKLALQGEDFSAVSHKVKKFVVKSPTVSVGKGAIIRSGSIIYNQVRIGENFRTGHDILIRENVTIGDNCLIGTKTNLDGFVRLGDHTMLGSHCYIAQSTEIGEGVFMGPNSTTVDNKNMILGKGLDGPRIGDFVRIGGGAIILPDIDIGAHSLIGAGSVVSTSILQGVLAFGNPARVIRNLTEEEKDEYRGSVMGWT